MEVDKKKIFNKTKHDLEEWRELILILNSVLKWEQKYYPGIIFGVVSFKFLMLWYLDFSILTLISLTALLVTVLDYGYPAISKFIFKSENWTGTQEKSYENVIQEIVDLKVCACTSIHNFCNSRSERSTFYLITVTLTSILLAWIGSSVNNLFLAYLIALFVSLYPGLHHNGLIQIVTDHVKNFISTHIKKAKPAEKAEYKGQHFEK
jgi:hypothetical protein